LAGPLVGALVWVVLDAFVSGFTVHWPLIIGLLVFFIVFFMPGGLMGLLGSYSAESSLNAEEEQPS
jgi:branched-chain amino acid transport system permease protein